MGRILPVILVPLIAASCGLFCPKSTDMTKNAPVLKTGRAAPDFFLRRQDQLRVTLSEFRGKKNVVLVFFPMAFTPV